jgi:phage terminase small subunit
LLYANNPTQAARLAGYSDKSEGAKVTAHHLMQNPHVLEALHEVSWKRLNGMAVKAIAALEFIVDTPEHPKHLRAVEMVLDRTGFAAQTEHKVIVEHKVNDLQIKALAARFADQLGVPAAKLIGANVAIEGEVVEVDKAT